MNPLSRLGAAFLHDHPQAAASVLEDFPAEGVARYLAAADTTVTRQVVAHFTPGFAASFLLACEPATAGMLFGQLLPDDQLNILRQLERGRRDSLLATLPAEPGLALRRLLPYTDGTAGALMEATMASVPESLTVRQTLKRIKRLRGGMKFYVYVTNPQGQLSGVMTLHELINASHSSSIAQLAHKRVTSLHADEPLRSVIDNPYWQDYHALPVTDGNQVLLGVIRQKRMHRLQEQVRHSDLLGNGLDTLVSIGALFSLSAGHLLAALIAGTSGKPKRD